LERREREQEFVALVHGLGRGHRFVRGTAREGEKVEAELAKRVLLEPWAEAELVAQKHAGTFGDRFTHHRLLLASFRSRLPPPHRLLAGVLRAAPRPPVRRARGAQAPPLQSRRPPRRR